MIDPRIQRAIDRAFDLGEVGLQVAAYRGSELIVDVAAGIADEKTGARVQPDTLFPVFSVSKAVTATAIHIQAERGFVELDEPIATYWPEYGAKGKGGITVRHVLTHRAGVPQMPTDLTQERLADWGWIVDRLAGVEPLWPAGERLAYHSIAFGYLLGEVVRRTDPLHRSIADFIQDEICAPLDIEDLWIGVPAEHEHRLARLTYGAGAPQRAAYDAIPNPVRVASVPEALALTPDVWNLPVVHRSCNPAASGIMNAQSGAKFFRLLANGGEVNGTRLLSRERLLALTLPASNPLQIDEARGVPVPLGVGGLHVGIPHPFLDPVVGAGPNRLSHAGAGGSIGWADLDSRLAVMITHNRMFSTNVAERHPFVGIGEAVRDVAADG